MKPIIDRFDNQSPAPRGDRRHSGPLFVVGMWRSGTSLLYALLNQHADIGLMYEDDLPLLRPLFITGKAKRDWIARWDFWNSAPQRHKINFAGLDSRPTLKRALEFCYQRAGTYIWGAKSPNYYDMMTDLADIFPDARFLIIWRDLRGICSSVLRAGSHPSWFSRAGMKHRTILGYREMKTQRDRLLRRGMLVHEIQYEALVSDTEVTMRGICNFLQIPFDPAMCSLKNADRSAVFEHQHHELVNSSKIVATRKKPETGVIPMRLQHKIARYVTLWKSHFQGEWPSSSVSSSADEVASLVERIIDRTIYRALRMYDHAIAMLYSYAPISLLRAYRAMKTQAPPLKTQPVSKTPESSTASVS